MIAGMPSVLWSTAGGRISAEARAKVFVRRKATRIGLGSSQELASGGRSRGAWGVAVVNQVQESHAGAAVSVPAALVDRRYPTFLICRLTPVIRYPRKTYNTLKLAAHG